tara:strand:+ start:5494 stop:6051 length:558 start_codon:yes stop_codon:yes gene_type:complete
MDSLEKGGVISAVNSSTKDLRGFGISAVFISKGLNNFGISVISFSPKTDAFFGITNGLGAYASFPFANEINSDPFGAEIALIYSYSSYLDLKNNSFGVGLNISKKAQKGSFGFLVPQLSVSFFPVSRTQLEQNQIDQNQLLLINSAVGFVLNLSSTSNLILEPSFGYNFEEKISSTGLAISFQFF